MALEKTLVILKPDAVARRLAGRILSRFEDKGFSIAAMKYMKIDAALADKHYAEHKEKPFFPSLTKFITSGPVIVLALEGVDAVPVIRKMVGATNGRAAEPGSIRGDFGMSRGFNLIHASDSPESAERELALFFKPEDFIHAGDQGGLGWNYEWTNGKPD